MADHPGKAFYEAVSSLLVNVAPCEFGARELPSHTQKARFVWVPLSDEIEPYQSASDLLGASKERFAVEVRGSTYDAAKWLQKALWTACFDAVKNPTLDGIRYVMGSATHSGNQDSKFGYTIEQELFLICPAHRVDLTNFPGYDLSDTTDVTTSEIDPDTATDGDGVLVAPNN